MKITVLGLGNIMFADEGFGVEAVRQLEAEHALPPEVEIIDGGTQGIYLLNIVEAADYLLIFDALIPPDEEIKVYTYRDEELPAIIHRKMSAHQIGLSELLTLAQLHGKVPKEIVLIGVPPQNLDLGVGLSTAIEGLLPEAIDAGKLVINGWLGVVNG
jgi:hydrogenase maturation protease